ncbi:hypothetical protein AB1A64_21195 [Ruegeria sp. ANG10]|uniref:hypothetical protein n=1 Tax=Ruegeria sp. ANG10 TaxID=3042467 RepID=UPI0034512B28
MFDTLHQGTDRSFDPAWHVRAMCHELDNVRVGENKRLIINIPPRCLKSVTVAVAYVAYLLGHNPSAKIIVASYGLDLARKHSEDCRRIMSARWYRGMFPETVLAKKGNTSEKKSAPQREAAVRLSPLEVLLLVMVLITSSSMIC